MTRRRILGVLLVAAAGLLVASGCSSTLSDAATLNYHDAKGDHTAHITRAELQDQVSALVANKALRKLLEQNYAVGEPGTSTDAKLTAVWLTQLIRDRAVQAEFQSRGLQLTPDAKATATSQVVQQYTPEVFNALPKSMQNDFVESQEMVDALLRSCASDRSVSHILVKTQAEAEVALAALQSGTPFATMAKSVSIDTGSKDAGGELGCLAPDEFVPEFQQAAERAQLGVVAGPVHTQYGYHLILVDHWDPKLADNAQFAQSLQQAAGAALDARLRGLHVRVDPRYGTWGVQQTQNGPVFAVAAPVPPDVRDKRA